MIVCNTGAVLAGSALYTYNAQCHHAAAWVNWRSWPNIAANAAAAAVVHRPLLLIAGDRADASPLMELGASEKVMVVTGNLSSVAHLQAAAHAKNSLQEQQQQQQQQQQGATEQQQQQLDIAAGPCPYFRVSFASVGSNEDLYEGFARLRRAVLRCQAAAAASSDGVTQ
jgi:hypothetical protein